MTLGAGHTNNTTVALSTGDDTVTATNYTGVLTVTVGADSIDGNDTITGGSGTSDVITLTTTANTLTAAELANVSGFENINVASNVTTGLITLADANIASGASLTVDATAQTNTNFLINASAESNGTITINRGASTGTATITLGQGNDTYTSTSTGVDTVTATAGANTISTGGGADVITSGAGADSITAGAGANRVILEATALNGSDSAMDTITDFTTGTYAVEIDHSASTGQFIHLDDSADGADDATAEFSTITGATDLGTVTANTNILRLNLTGNLANTDAVETALEINGDLALTVGGATAVDDVFFVLYDDGTDSFLAEVRVLQTAANDTKFGTGTLNATNLVKFTGESDHTANIAAADFVFN